MMLLTIHYIYIFAKWFGIINLCAINQFFGQGAVHFSARNLQRNNFLSSSLNMISYDGINHGLQKEPVFRTGEDLGDQEKFNLWRVPL